MKRNIKAVGYVRVSTEEQAREGISLEAQKNSIRAYAESQNWELLSIYEDIGVSGKSLARPALQQLMNKLKSEDIDVLLVYRVDRLTRKQKDLWYLFEDVFDCNNVGFKSVTESFDTTTAQGKAFLGMLGIFAQLERETISDRTKFTLNNKRKNQEHIGRIPYGFEIGKKGKLRKNPAHQKQILLAKKLRRDGKSYRDIARRLNVSLGTTHKIINTHLKSLNSKYCKEIGG